MHHMISPTVKQVFDHLLISQITSLRYLGRRFVLRSKSSNRFSEQITIMVKFERIHDSISSWSKWSLLIPHTQNANNAFPVNSVIRQCPMVFKRTSFEDELLITNRDPCPLVHLFFQNSDRFGCINPMDLSTTIS